MPILAACAVMLVTGQQPATWSIHGRAGDRGARGLSGELRGVCHVDDLGGRFEAPQLAGADFINQWGDRIFG